MAWGTDPLVRVQVRGHSGTSSGERVVGRLHVSGSEVPGASVVETPWAGSGHSFLPSTALASWAVLVGGDTHNPFLGLSFSLVECEVRPGASQAPRNRVNSSESLELAFPAQGGGCVTGLGLPPCVQAAFVGRCPVRPRHGARPHGRWSRSCGALLLGEELREVLTRSTGPGGCS